MAKVNNLMNGWATKVLYCNHKDCLPGWHNISHNRYVSLSLSLGYSRNPHCTYREHSHTFD